MSDLLKYKGIHPGVILKRELKKRDLKQRPLALAIHEHPQTFNSILQGKRKLKLPLALRIEEKLGLEEGILAHLQTYYDIKMAKEKMNSEKPDLSLLRKSLFWDTDMNSINWQKQYKAVIKRIFERGNEEEKKEILRFYGPKKVNAVLHSATTFPM